MKIRRYNRTTQVTPFAVTGPDVEKLGLPSYGCAVAFAMDWASRTGSTFHVREHGDIIGRAEGGEKAGTAVFVERGA